MAQEPETGTVETPKEEPETFQGVGGIRDLKNNINFFKSLGWEKVYVRNSLCFTEEKGLA